MCCGGGGSNTNQSTSTQTPPASVLADYNAAISRDTSVANTPYQMYQGELVAPESNQTISGTQQVGQYGQSAQPAIQTGEAYTAASPGTGHAGGWDAAAGNYAGAYGAGSSGWNPAQAATTAAMSMGSGSNFAPNLNTYMSPYLTDVVNKTAAEFQNQNQQQAEFLNSSNISSGAFGGDRAGISQAILAGQQQQSEAPVIAGLYQAGFGQAEQELNAQQAAQMQGAGQLSNIGTNRAQTMLNAATGQGALGSAEANNQLAAGSQYGSLGLAGQGAALQGGEANIQAGLVPTEFQQAADTSAYGQFEQGQAYPFTTASFLTNAIEGLGGQSGGTGQTSTPGPSGLAQGIGAAADVVGTVGKLFGFSDERLKENIEPIGETYDGQQIYRYNFKGDPRTQIGLMAQEEAYRHPRSVIRVGLGGARDLLGLDYHGATEEAAQRGRGHFAGGGTPSPDQALMFGGVHGASLGAFGPSYGLDIGESQHADPGGAPLVDPTRTAMQSFHTPSAGRIPPIEMMPAMAYGGGIFDEGRQSFDAGGGTLPGGGAGPLSFIDPSVVEGIVSGVNQNEDVPSGWVNPDPMGLSGSLYASGGNNLETYNLAQGIGVNKGAWNPKTGMSPWALQTVDWQDLGANPQWGNTEYSFTPAAQKGAAAGMAAGDVFPSPIVPGNALSGTNAFRAQENLPPLAEGQPAKPLPTTPAPSTPAPKLTPPTPQKFTTMTVPGYEHVQAGWEPSGTRTMRVPVGSSLPKFSGLNQVPAGGDANSGGGGAGGSSWETGGAVMREGYQGGGAPFPDPRFSYYSPTTGQGRGATYHTPAPPPPPPPAIAVARQIARSRAAPARRAPMPPPRPTDTGPLHDRPPWQEPYFHDRPPVTGDHYPDGVTDPQVPYRGFGKIIPPESLEPSGGKVPPRGFSDPQLPPPEPEYLQPEGAGTFLRNLPGRVTRMLPGGRLIEMGRRILSPDPLQPATGVEAPRTLGRSPSGPGPTIHAGPPPSHVTDLGTWENEGGAPGSTFQPSWSRDANPTDPDVQNMMNEGGRWRGGRASYADGGGPYDPGGSVGDWEGLDASNMSDDDFARGLEGEMRDAKPEDLGWISHLPTNFNFDQPARTRMQPMRGIDPGMRAEAPGGGGGSTNPNFGVTSLMGGNPITTANVGNIFGHYQPTTGIAGRGQWVQDSIPSNATAQVAGTHPAIAMRRRLSGHPAHTRAPPRAGPPDMSHHYDPLAGQPTGIPYGPPDMSGHYDPLAGQPTGITYGNPHGDDPPDVMSPEAVYNATRRYQGGGGVMGSSPYPNSAEQAKGLGSFASTKQSAGFGDLFGRQGFQLGGGSSNDQNDINAAISRAVQSMGSGHGANLPTAQPYKPPSGDQPGSPGDIAKHLQSMADNLTKKPTQTTSGSTTPSSSGIHPLVDTSSQAAPAPAPTQTSQGPAQVSVVNQNTDVADASLSGAGMDMGGGDVADAWRGGRTWRR